MIIEQKEHRYIHAQVADVACSGAWLRLQDAALDFGVCHTTGLQTLARLMSPHGRGIKPCPL